ncbi:MAG: C-GCAxxG-C-C family protein [Deferribacterota bacterium]|nr:C-GCAxxG-C-C family protein [Deferribacterota bacterium]
MEKKEILEKAFDNAKKHELESGGCAQCCLAGIFEALGVEDDGVFMTATGFADGIGLTGNGHCGALSGGVMAIGYFFGRPKKMFSDMKKQIKACILSKKLHDAFVEKYGTCRCKDLQEKLVGRFFNLYNPKEIAAALEAGMPEKCSSIVGETARMTVHIILEEQDREANIG